VCGIAGFVDPQAEALESRAAAMARALAHRGPDDTQVWFDADQGLALAHTRLAVIDLSDCGRQPMWTPDHSKAIVFNGEIYNYREIASDLEQDGYRFRGHSDTEVLLAAIERWGIDGALRRTIGMFALAVWDTGERTLTLARDRVGIKPLYYGLSSNVFFFASELKALHQHPRFDPVIAPLALSFQTQYGYIPAPHSIYEGIYKLLPGHHLRVAIDNRPCVDLSSARLGPYWSLEEAAATNRPQPIADREAIDRLDELLRSSIAYRMIADVPLGAFLSGGIDSSMVVALMSQLAQGRVRTFSIAFVDDGYDESHHARRVARHLGTDHTELQLTSADAMAVIEDLPRMFDEPFSDSSQIPTFLVSRLARQSVTVSLSGDGGDELFAGYNRHVWPRTVSRLSRALSPGIRAAMRRAVLSPATRLLVSSLAGAVPALRVDRPGERLQKLASVLGTDSTEELYLLCQQNFAAAHPVKGHEAPRLPGAMRFPIGSDFLRWAMLVDLASYLPDDLLAKLDRASMAVALEARVPFLDHRVIEFSLSLPPNLKLRKGERKWILREVLARYVPRDWFARPKMGFSVPIGAWLRGDLREWAESLLGSRTLEQHGYFETGTIRRYWEDHLQGKGNYQHALWSILMFEQWMRHQREPVKS